MLPDYRKGTEVHGHQATPEQQTEALDRLRTFMQQHDQVSSADKAFLLQASEEEMKANRVNMVALDAALRTVDIRLADFIVDRRLGPLQLGERRYYLPRGRLPVKLQVQDRDARSCIERSEDGKVIGTRLEFPRLPKPPRLLHCVLDRGPCSWPMMTWLYTRMQVWGTWSPDPPHLLWSDMKAAMKTAGLWPSYLEGTLLCGFKGGPFNGCAFLGCMRDAAKNYAKRVTRPEEDDLFMHLYTDICADLGRESPTTFGTLEHIRAVHSQMLSVAMNLKKGDKVKGARWFSFFHSAAQLLPTWTVQLLILIWIGINSGWFKGVSDSPLFQRVPPNDALPVVEAVDGAAPAAVEASVGEAPRGVRHSDPPDLQTLRKACRNTMHVACTLLGDQGVRAKIALLVGVVAPVKEAFDKMITQMKTRKGCRFYLCDMATGSYDEVLVSIFRKFDDPELLSSMRLAGSSDDVDPCHIEHERFLVRKVFDLVWALIGQRCFSLSLYSQSLPWRFVSLIDDDPAVRKEALESLEELWQVLEDAERAALGSNWMKGFLSDLVWTRMPWVRYVMLSLSEVAHGSTALVRARCVAAAHLCSPTLLVRCGRMTSARMRSVSESGFGGAPLASVRVSRMDRTQCDVVHKPCPIGVLSYVPGTSGLVMFRTLFVRLTVQVS